MDLIKNWKLHLLALLIVIVAELIGMQRFDLIIFLPLFYALIIGGIISYPNFKILKLPEMERASRVLSIGMLILVTKLGLDIGPNLQQLMHSSLALLVQEFGHFFGTLVFGLPVAFLVGMKREAIGACYSIDREPNIAIIAERYGLDSPEGRGVMGMYICGTVFGALWVSVLAGVIAQMGIFHPHIPNGLKPFRHTRLPPTCSRRFSVFTLRFSSRCLSPSRSTAGWIPCAPRKRPDVPVDSKEHAKYLREKRS